MRAFSRIMGVVWAGCLSMGCLSMGMFSMGAATANAAYGPVTVPTPLQPWQDWVMQDQAAYPCPFSLQDFETRVCAWPTSLNLDIERSGAGFSQHWQVYQAGYVALPGGDKVWPQEVMLNGKPAPIIVKDQHPFVYAAAGSTEIKGRLRWTELPDAISLPVDTALLTVTRNGERVVFPNLDAEGRFWLKQPQVEETQAPAQEEQVTVRVYRHLTDNVPFEVETLVEAEVSGKPREVVLGPALLPGYQLQSFSAQLPARLEEGGLLRAQLRAGLWQFRVTGHRTEAVTDVTKPASTAPWPDDEIWVFQPETHLRTVRVEDVDALDPQQTTLPDEWRQWQAYRLTSEQPLKLAVLRRGDPEPSPNQFNLEKTLWLDFSGGGWTIRDELSGQVNRHWRVQTDGQMSLGEANVNGQPQVITRLADQNDANRSNDGVEVRNGSLRLNAVSRIEAEGAPRHWMLSVSGWQEDFQQLSARINLPPGWQLLTAGGVDNASPTWLGNWSVWDVFLLLIAVAAVGKVLGWRWSVVALVALGLVYPESAVLLFLVLNLVAALALSRLLEAGRLRTVIDAYGRLSAFVLVMAILPFVVEQVRLAIYPQLQHASSRISDLGRYDSYSSLSSAAPAAAMAPAEADSAQEAGMVEEMPSSAPEPKRAEPLRKPRDARIMTMSGAASAQRAAQKEIQQEIDPQQAAQTGPGLPRWGWESASLSWSGPVAEGQTVDLWLLGPTENRVLALLRVVLLAVLVAALLGVQRKNGQWHWVPTFLRGSTPGKTDGTTQTTTQAATPTTTQVSASVLAVMLVFGLAGHSPSAQAEEAPSASSAATSLPDNSLLETLRERLWNARNCTPDCVGIETVNVQIEGTRLTLSLGVGALEEVELPLPDSQGQWQPQSVVIDGASELAMRRQDGIYSVVVPKGAQRITLSGPLRQRDAFQLSFAQAAHNVSVQAPGWNVQGIDQGQLTGGALLFAPEIVEKRREETPTLTQEPAPAFVTVNRNLRLGLTWQIVTQVVRVAPEQGAVQLEIPLLAGESVLTRDIDVSNGKARVALKANQSSVEWVSNLEPVAQLTFTAAQTAQWVETWSADISPLWHVDFEGIDPLKSQGSLQWRPTFRPYPGETLTLHIQKPAAKPGATATIDQVSLSANPGARESSFRLDLHVRTSKGGEQRLTLPEGIHLTEVLLDGQAQASEEANRNVVLQVAPGDHQVSAEWRSDDAMKGHWVTPLVSLSEEVARNVDLTVNVPEGRWVLFVGGPAIGPAVLFWGMALVLLVVAVILGKLPLSPLKSWQWVLLVLGFSTGSWFGLTVVALWFFALAWREKHLPELSETQFNLLQLALVGLTIFALAAFVEAIPAGLLGTPDMDISGNGSSMGQLNWYQDVMQQTLPQAWVISVPLWTYRALMLLWSLWVAVTMLRWLPWAWKAYSTQGYWRSSPRKPRPPKGNLRKGTQATSPDAAAAQPSPASAGDNVQPVSPPGRD